MLVTAALSVPAAFADRTALRRAQALKMFREPLRTRLVNDSIRREIMRVGKHLVCVGMIALSFYGFGAATYHAAGDGVYLMIIRNWGFATISAVMLANTILDHRTRAGAINR